MVEQTKEALAISNKAISHGTAVFAFGNSSGHACKAHGATSMNLGPSRQTAILPNEAGQSVIFRATYRDSNQQRLGWEAEGSEESTTRTGFVD